MDRFIKRESIVWRFIDPIKHFEVVIGFLIWNMWAKIVHFHTKRICKLARIMGNYVRLIHSLNAQIINWPSEQFTLECWNQWVSAFRVKWMAEWIFVKDFWIFCFSKCLIMISGDFRNENRRIFLPNAYFLIFKYTSDRISANK